MDLQQIAIGESSGSQTRPVPKLDRFSYQPVQSGAMTPRKLLVFFLLVGTAFGQSAYETALKNLKFRSIGPAQMGGRVDDLAIVESDPRIIYVGAAAGGIFKTVNGGADLAGDFRRPAESFDRRYRPCAVESLHPLRRHRRGEQPPKFVVGQRRLSNRWTAAPPGLIWAWKRPITSGASWCIPPIPTSSTSPRWATCGDRTRSAASTRAPTAAPPGRKTLFINEDTGVNDIAIDPQSPNILYATAYQRRRTVFGYNGGGPGSGIYRSTDGGSHWTKLTHGLPARGDLGRCALDIYRKNTNIVYARSAARNARRRLSVRRQRRDLDAHERYRSAAVVFQPDSRRSQ